VDFPAKRRMPPARALTNIDVIHVTVQHEGWSATTPNPPDHIASLVAPHLIIRQFLHLPMEKSRDLSLFARHAWDLNQPLGKADQILQLILN
jgi:hypothetical protein